MRQKAKVDDNQAEIVDALRAVGASVAVTSAQHKGFPDLVVGYMGKTFLLEVKDGSKPPSARRLTSDQERFFADWQGHCAVVCNAEEALAEIGHSPNLASLQCCG